MIKSPNEYLADDFGKISFYKKDVETIEVEIYKSIGECNSILSAYTLYRHLG